MMDIDEILNHDFSNESNIELLRESLKELQDYIQPEFKWEPPLDDDIKEIWEDDWSIKSDGTMQLLYGTQYTIEGSRLTEQNWLSHILEKDFGRGGTGECTFYFAYLEALKEVGVNKIELDITADKIRFIR